MAKGLPYFKFISTEWLTGDICFESFEVQGLFINICAVYWQRDGNLSIEDLEKRYKKPTALDSLLGRFILVKDGFISIKFLDEQLQERNHISAINSTNGSKGGRPKTQETKPTAKRPLSEKKPIRRRIRSKEEKEFIVPTLLEVQGYFKEKGYTDQQAKKAFDYYSESNWHDRNGDKVLNWKQKMLANWMKDEGKLIKGNTETAEQRSARLLKFTN